MLRWNRLPEIKATSGAAYSRPASQSTWALAKYTRLCLGFRFLCNRLSWNSVSTKDERKAAEWRPWKGKERDSSFPKFDFYETSLRNWLVSKMLMPILLLLHFNKYLLYKLLINICAVSLHTQIQHPSTHPCTHSSPPPTHTPTSGATIFGMHP